MEGFSRFSGEAATLARRVFESRHIDSGVRAGKRGGAFCYSVTPERDPWVLVNYTGEPREVATLAHELGHALHSLLARGHSVLTFQAPLPLAETASVFSEMLLTDLLLERETDAAARRDMIAAKLDDMYATVLRQAFFVLFERQAHQMAAQGATVDEMSAAYLENLRAQFGDVGRGRRDVPARVDHHPAPLPRPVLLLRLQLRDAALALALPALQAGGRGLRARVHAPAGPRRRGVPGGRSSGRSAWTCATPASGAAGSGSSRR